MTRLDVLLAHVLVDFNDQVDAARRPLEGSPNLVQWSNFLRVVTDEGLSPNDIALAARVSRRAIKSRSGMNTAWIATGSLAPRQPWWRLTDLGLQARAKGREIIAAAEEEWRRKAGEAKTAMLHSALEAVVQDLELELSHYPMPYGSADGSVTGGRSVPPQPGPPRLPAHGADWWPVVRDPTSSCRDLPLYALAAQAYTAFHIDYEQLSGGAAIPGMSSLAQAFPTPRLPLAEVPARLHIDGSGKGGLERHGIVHVTTEGSARIASLTSRGRALVDHHASRLEAVEAQWRAQHGSALVDKLRTALESVDAALPPHVPDHCIVRSWRDVSRVVARPKD